MGVGLEYGFSRMLNVVLANFWPFSLRRGGGEAAVRCKGGGGQR